MAGLKVQITSDLHLEFYDDVPSVLDIVTPSAPYLALLGDIFVVTNAAGREAYMRWLRECLDHFDRVLVLLGNHEYYSSKKEPMPARDVLNASRECIQTLSKSTRRDGDTEDRVVLLENESLVLDGVRVAGCTLWSEVHEIHHTAEAWIAAGMLGKGLPIAAAMNDYNKIYDGDDLLTPHETTAWHRASVEFIQEQAGQATEAGQNLLVLTHHTPSFQAGLNPQHAAGAHPWGMGSAFSSNLEGLLGRTGSLQAIHTWGFGHTHYNTDAIMGNVRVLSNQRGYHPDSLSQGYRPDCVVDIPAELVPPGVKVPMTPGWAPSALVPLPEPPAFPVRTPAQPPDAPSESKGKDAGCQQCTLI